MGEFTIASLAAFHTFPTTSTHERDAGVPSGGLSLLSFGITWAAMLASHARRSPAPARPVRRCRLDAVRRARALHRSFGPCQRSTASASRSKRASSSRCSDRAAAERQLRCASLPGSTGPTRAASGRRQGHDSRPAQQARHGDGLPGVQPLPEHDATRNVEYGLRIRARRGRIGRRRSPSCSSSSGSNTPAIATHISSPAACSSASPLRGPSRSSHARSCSTSRSPRSTPRCACSCARRSGASRAASGSRRSTSRTIRRRRSRSPTASRCSSRGGSNRSPLRVRSTTPPQHPSWRSSWAR